MLTEITVQHDKLNRTVYRFNFLDMRKILRLNYYFEQTRETTRHGWKNVKSYDSFDHRKDIIKAEDIVIPDEVKEQAIAEYIKDIKVEV